MSKANKGSFENIMELYDFVAVWLREAVHKGDGLGVKAAESRCRQIDLAIAKARFEK